MKINEHGLLTETLEISDDRMKDIAGGMPLEGIEPCGSIFTADGKGSRWQNCYSRLGRSQ